MAPTWESLTERLIREAQERGDFDGLPGQGKPIMVDDDARAGEMGLAFHMLRNAGAAPPWIEADKDVRGALDERDRLCAQARAASARGVMGRLGQHRLHEQLERLIERHDAAVARLNASAPSLSLHRRPLDRTLERARLEAAMATDRVRAPGGHPTSAEPT
jgi:hypothetical protein